IGPDDFRYPYDKVGLPFALWVKRRQWVNGKLARFKKDREANGLEFILKQVFGDPLPDLEGLKDTVAQENASVKVNEAKKQLTEGLHLTVESFTRLMAIRGKDQRKEQITEEEWGDVYSIL